MINFLKKIYYKLSNNNHSEDFNPSSLPKDLEELPFTIVMMGYNNEKYIEKSINSALSQSYSNFNVIYNEACSTDSSAKILESINHEKLIKRINNPRQYRLQNLYESIHSVADDRIILELDGDDYLKDEFVLARLNCLYQHGYYIIHGNYLNNPPELAELYNYKTFSQKTPNLVQNFGLFRKFPWIYSGLRSYYAWLFKKIDKEDLMFDGQFSPVCCDVATMFPMLEMAPSHVGYIAEKLLIRNIDSPINEFKVITDEQKRIRKLLEDKKPYERIF